MMEDPKISTICVIEDPQIAIIWVGDPRLAMVWVVWNLRFAIIWGGGGPKIFNNVVGGGDPSKQ